MKGKKGFGITMFIILGIIILIIVGFFIAVRGELVSLIKPRGSDAGAVQIYAENCLDSVAKYSAYTIGKQGGSIYLNPNHFASLFLGVNYAFEGSKTFPSMDSLKLEMEQFIDGNLKNCTDGFRGFKQMGMQIEEGDVNSTVILGPKSFIVRVDYPIKIISGDRETSIDVIQKEIPINLGRIFTETDNFVSGFSDRYNLTYLRGRSSSTYIIPFDEADLFVESSTESRLFGDNYLFLYSVR